MAKRYPIHVEIYVHITNGEQEGTVTFGCGVNNLPSEEEMPAIIDKVKSALPDGFRLMTRHESFIYYAREQRGYRGPNNIAMPGLKDGDEWHDPETANCYMASDEDQYEEEEF